VLELLDGELLAAEVASIRSSSVSATASISAVRYSSTRSAMSAGISSTA
jgi:hypothetical protein